MFSDLVGSTALSARMDPEDLREIITAYQKCVAETVQRFGVRSEVHGRRRLGLLWVSPSPRGRRQASRAGGAGIGGGCSCLESVRALIPSAFSPIWDHQSGRRGSSGRMPFYPTIKWATMRHPRSMMANG